MLRLALGVLFLLHGFAHLVGFFGAFGLGDVPYKTTILAGSVDLGDAGIRAMGVVWLAIAVAFAAAAAVTWRRVAWWLPFAIGVVALSLALCTLELPAAQIGLGLNVILLVLLGVGAKRGWFASPQEGARV